MKHTRVFSIICLLILSGLTSNCQNKPQEPELVFCLEEPPTFPGGENALFKFIDSNKIYPNNWRVDSIQGRVFLLFTIDSCGTIKDLIIKKGLNPTLDSMALTIVKKMPKWSPGRQRNKPIAVQLNLPITFGNERNKLNKKH